MASKSAPRIDLKNISFRYGSKKSTKVPLVLSDVSLTIEPGEAMTLLGPSGCGKTTLLRIIAGLERPTAGCMSIGDRVVASMGSINGTGPAADGTSAQLNSISQRTAHMQAPSANGSQPNDTSNSNSHVPSNPIWVPPQERNVGLVFQDWALFPHMSVADNVAYGLRGNNGEKRERVCEALELVELAHLADRMPNTLSGGQQQRVALARALAPRPQTLLLDEPFSNLDTAMRVEVRADVRRLLNDLGITSVFVTHDQEEAFVVGDRVAVMRDGVIVQADTPRQIYREPADREIAEFVGSGRFVKTNARAGVAATPIGKLNVTVSDGPVEVLLRPEDMELFIEKPDPKNNGHAAYSSSHFAGNGCDAETVEATVDLVEFHGHDAMVTIEVASLLVDIRTGPFVPVRRGDRVWVRHRAPVANAYPCQSC